VIGPQIPVPLNVLDSTLGVGDYGIVEKLLFTRLIRERRLGYNPISDEITCVTFGRGEVMNASIERIKNVDNLFAGLIDRRGDVDDLVNRELCAAHISASGAARTQFALVGRVDVLNQFEGPAELTAEENRR
jgi:hypothetical protein